MSTDGMDQTRLERIRPWMQSWIDDGRLAGLSVLVHHRGRTVLEASAGDADTGQPWASDTVVRLYSMTKPLASAALMTLYEEGRFQLDDPIARVLPAFADMRVWDGSEDPWSTTPADRPITYRQLLTHTSGLTYGFMQATPVDALYRDRGLDPQLAPGTLEQLVDGLAAMPLLAQPGTRWNYSVATDVVGRLVEIHAGQPFDAFLHDRILAPLGMTDTGFAVRPDQRPRWAANHVRGRDGQAKRLPPELADDMFTTPRLPSGGGGLVGTAPDYLRFCRMILGAGEGQGGTLDGTRILGRKTVQLMTANHLHAPPDNDMAALGTARFSESTYEGIGFGLGFSVMLNPARAQILGTPGEVAWGGAASTAFWIDPAEDLIVILLTQLTPSSTYPLRRQLRVLTYGALAD